MQSFASDYNRGAKSGGRSKGESLKHMGEKPRHRSDDVLSNHIGRVFPGFNGTNLSFEANINEQRIFDQN